MFRLISKLYILVLVVIIVLPLSNRAFSINSNIKASSFYSYDYLRWSIASSGVNVRSELTWHDVHVLGFILEYQLFVSDYYFDASFSYGFILSGKNRDSDYNIPDRKGEFSRSYSDSKGSTLSAYLSFGPTFDFKQRKLTLIPLSGLFVRRGSYNNFPTGKNIDSIYTNNWIGAWGGIKLLYSPIKIWSLDFLFRISVSYYYAVADWILREEFQHPKSFTHNTFGIGSYISFSNNFRVHNNISINLTLLFDGLFAPFNGKMTVFYSGQGTVAKQGAYNSLLNEVISMSVAITAGLLISF